MSLSSAHLAAALNTPVLYVDGKLSPREAEALRKRWHDSWALNGGGKRITFLQPGQPFAPPLPIPFRWGPNGAFLLLLAMLSGYSLIIAAAVFLFG